MNVRAVHFPLFDSLRAAAVLMVITAHTVPSAIAGNPHAAIRTYLPQLGVAPSIFFLISGFLLYRPYVAARLQGRRWLPVHVYAWRRFLRVAPAYWVGLTVVAVWLGLPGVLSGPGIPHYYLWGQVFSKDTLFGGLPQSWSITVEIGFYAFLPLYAFAMGAGRARTRSAQLRVEVLMVAILFVAGVAFNAAVVSSLAPGAYTPLERVLPGFMDHFAAGMALAVLSVAWQDRASLPAPLRPLDRFPGLAWAAALALFWVVSTKVGPADIRTPATDAQFLERRALYLAIAACFVLPAIFGDQTRGLIRRLLGSRAMLYAGLVSYGLYLYHLAVLRQLDHWHIEVLGHIHPYLKVIDVFVPSLVLASISYYAIERPALRLKRVFGPRREPAPREAVAEPAPAGPLTVPRAAD